MRNIFQLLFNTKAQSTARAYPGLCGTKQLSVVMVLDASPSLLDRMQSALKATTSSLSPVTSLGGWRAARSHSVSSKDTMQ